MDNDELLKARQDTVQVFYNLYRKVDGIILTRCVLAVLSSMAIKALAGRLDREPDDYESNEFLAIYNGMIKITKLSKYAIPKKQNSLLVALSRLFGG